MAALFSLRQLRYLLALAEHMNFTRAAQASFVSQSTLSTGLKELESTLGVQLVERNKQTVALTAVGKEVVAEATDLRRQIGLAEARKKTGLNDAIVNALSGYGPWSEPAKKLSAGKFLFRSMPRELVLVLLVVPSGLTSRRTASVGAEGSGEDALYASTKRLAIPMPVAESSPWSEPMTSTVLPLASPY